MSLLRKPNELTAPTAVRAILYGMPGVGKTTFALTSPSPVLFDFDGGISRVDFRLRPALGTVECLQYDEQGNARPVMYEEVSQAMAEVLAMPECKSIVIDTVGKMLACMDEYIIRQNPRMRKSDGSLSLQGYGVRKKMFADLIGQIIRSGKHAIFVAHAKTTPNKNGDTVRYTPDMGGSAYNELAKEMDLIGFIDCVGSDRQVSFAPTEWHDGKNCIGMGSDMKVADTNSGNKPMAEVCKMYAERLRNIEEVNARYTERLNEIIAAVAGAKSAKDLNELCATYTCSDYEHLYDTKTQAAVRMKARAEELGLEYDKEAKKYVKKGGEQ